MQTRTVDRWTRLVGVALLVTAGFSTGLEHAHPGGLDPHHHHDGVPSAPAAGRGESTAATWFATPLHMHIFLLGFQFTLPTQDSSTDEPPRGGEHMLVVRLMGDDLTDSAARLPTGSGAVPIEMAPNATMLAVIEPVFSLANCPCCTPLCDAARHERSGVLRI